MSFAPSTHVNEPEDSCIFEPCIVRFSNPNPRICIYRGADKSLARPTSRCILFDGENISFDVSLVIYINSTNIPPIMIINRILLLLLLLLVVVVFSP